MIAMVGTDPMPRPDRTTATYGPEAGICAFLAVCLFFYILLDGPLRRGPRK